MDSLTVYFTSILMLATIKLALTLSLLLDKLHTLDGLGD